MKKTQTSVFFPCSIFIVIQNSPIFKCKFYSSLIFAALIYFHYQDTHFRPRSVSHLKNWLKKVARKEGYTITDVHYIFCSDPYLLQINREHLNHNYYTDIITFDNSEKKLLLEADIFISIDRVKENAGAFKQPFHVELKRVMVHGLLHLMGYKDKSSENKTQMRKQEDHYLLLEKRLNKSL